MSPGPGVGTPHARSGDTNASHKDGPQKPSELESQGQVHTEQAHRGTASPAARSPQEPHPWTLFTHTAALSPRIRDRGSRGWRPEMTPVLWNWVMGYKLRAALKGVRDEPPRAVPGRQLSAQQWGGAGWVPGTEERSASLVLPVLARPLQPPSIGCF